MGFRRSAGLDTDLPGEEPPELGEHLDEEVLASEIGDDALLDLAAFAVGFDDADVFVDGAAGGADFHGSRVHESHYHDESLGIQGVDSVYSRPILNQIVTTVFGLAGGHPVRRVWKARRFRTRGPPARAASPQTWVSFRPALALTSRRAARSTPGRNPVSTALSVIAGSIGA